MKKKTKKSIFVAKKKSYKVNKSSYVEKITELKSDKEKQKVYLMKNKRKSKIILICSFIFLCIVMTTQNKVYAANILTGERIAGNDRYGTSIDIANKGWTSTYTAIVATGEEYADALSAAPLGKKYDAPILLNHKDSLDSEVSSELSKLGVKNVYIIGGKGIISDTVKKQIEDKGIACTRIGGANRYETSAAVAGMMNVNGSIIVVTGENYPDAVSIASWASIKSVPILLTQKNNISQAVKDFISKNENKIKVTYVIGGNGVISDKVKNALINSQRIYGNNRFDTNAAVVKKFKDDFDFSSIYIATGCNFPDALSCSSSAAKTNSPIFLDAPAGNTSIKTLISSIRNSINNVYIIGGSGAVSSNSLSKIIPDLVLSIEITMPNNYLKLNEIEKSDVKVNSVSSTSGVSFKVEDPSVIDVDKYGNVKGLNKGVTKLTVSIGNLSSAINVGVEAGNVIVIDPGHGGWSSGATVKKPDGKTLKYPCEKDLNLQVSEKLKEKLQNQGMLVLMTRNTDEYVSLEDRVKMANDANSYLFISIHHNSRCSTSTGTMALYSYYKPSIDTSGLDVVAVDSNAVYPESDTKDSHPVGHLKKGTHYKFVKEIDRTVYIMFNGSVCKTTIYDVMIYDSTPSAESVKSKAFAENINNGIASLGIYKEGVFDHNLFVTRWTKGVSVLVEVGYISNYNEYLKISKSSFQDNAVQKIVNSINWYKNNY